MQNQQTNSLNILCFIKLFTLRFIQDSGSQRAAGLAYSTLLAVVPLFSVLVSFGGPFMNNVKVQTFLASALLPAMQAPIMEALTRFTENGKRLGGLLGLPMFLLSALFLLNNIEITFNRIFNVKNNRTLLRRLITYFLILVFAGLFLGAGITLSGHIFRAHPEYPAPGCGI